MTDPSLQRARQGLVLVAALLALLLAGTAGWSWRSIADLDDAAVRGQALLHLEAVRQVLSEDGAIAPQDPDTLARLEAVLAQEEPAGLRWIALLGPGGEVLVEAGRAVGRWQPGEDDPQGRRVGERVRITLPLPPRRGPRFGPPRRLGERPDAPAGRPADGPDRDEAAAEVRRRDGPPPRISLELEPSFVGATQRRRAALAFGVATLAALVLVGAAVRVGRQLADAEAARAHAAEQERLAGLGRMSAVLAHEIRNPLAGLKGHAQLLAELAEDGPLAPRAARIVGTAERLEALLDDLLAFVRDGDDPARRRPTPLADWIDAGVAEAGSSATVHRDDAPHTWVVDPVGARRAVINLVRNAEEASPGEVEVQVTVDGGALVVDVLDRGPGVPEDRRERVFEPFHTARTRGTGLGLALVRRVATLHGGAATCDARPGGGAAFRMTFPPA